MGVNGRFDDIRREDLLVEADRFGGRRATALLAEVRAAVDNWKAFAAEAELPAVTTDRVAKDFRAV
jgi:serine/threonine-protein kinase HipA